MLNYANELAIIKEILGSNNLVEEILIKFRAAPDGPLHEFRIGKVDSKVVDAGKKLYKEFEDAGLIKKEMWAS